MIIDYYLLANRSDARVEKVPQYTVVNSVPTASNIRLLFDDVLLYYALLEFTDEEDNLRQLFVFDNLTQTQTADNKYYFRAQDNKYQLGVARDES